MIAAAASTANGGALFIARRICWPSVITQRKDDQELRQLSLEEWCEQVNEDIYRLKEDVQQMKNDQLVDKQIDAMIQLNEKLMSNSSNYTNLIMVAGYAGFFAFWSTLTGKIPAMLFSACGLLITLSLTLFIGWEIIKMFWSAKHMRRTQAILAQSRRPATVADYEKAIQQFNVEAHKVWMMFLIPSVITGVLAAVMLVGFFCRELVCTVRVCT